MSIDRNDLALELFVRRFAATDFNDFPGIPDNDMIKDIAKMSYVAADIFIEERKQELES